MNLALSLFGIMIIAVCLWGMATPKSLLAAVLGVWNKPWGIYFAIAIRLALGILFILAAEGTRFPVATRMLGYLMVLAAFAIALFGRNRLDRFMDWWRTKSPALIRAWLVFGILFGAFIVYAAN